MIQNSINQMISLASKTASKIQKLDTDLLDFNNEKQNTKGADRAALAVKQKQEQANNNFIKNYVTPGDIRRELEAKEAEKAKVAAEKGIYEEDYFDEGGNR